jgi:hypothetical protein
MEGIKLKVINEIIDLIISCNRGKIYHFDKSFLTYNKINNIYIEHKIIAFLTGENMIRFYDNGSLIASAIYFRKSNQNLIIYLSKFTLLDLQYLKLIMKQAKNRPFQ